MSNESALTIQVQLGLPSGDEQQLDLAARQLRGELLELELDSVELASGGAAPQGVKGLEMDPALLGALVVSLGPLALDKLLGFLHDWAMRRQGRSVKIKIQTAEGAAVEVEVPETMEPAQVQAWIEMVGRSLPKGGKPKK
ncbi:MAG: hypothetical protein JXA78_17195 [Anaerolineales bacterium]|nr:hypothetical protein [Anaerolineales bacterium]